MADYKLNLTPQPIKPEPDPLRQPDPTSTSTFEVGSGSEGPVLVERSSSEDLHDTARDIADEAHARMNEVAARASKVADQTKQRLHDTRARFNERWPIWKQQARERANDARLVARQTAIQADEKARRHPIETIAAAAGAGFLIGATMRIWRSSRG